jgi:hypothetical protein
MEGVVPVRALGRLVADAPGVIRRISGCSVDAYPRSAGPARAVQAKLVPLPADPPALGYQIRYDWQYILVQLSPDAPQLDELSLRHMTSERSGLAER